MKPLLASAAGLAALLLAATPAAADRRSFTRTYEYMTMPEGETELEIYTTQSKTTFDNPSPKEFELMLEVEHGLTERWDFSIYHVFKQSTGPAPEDESPFHFDEIKLRSRYRFAERGELPVDLLAYGEIIKVFGEGVWEAEAKAIIARDFDKLTAAVNLIGEVKFGPSVPEAEVEAGYAAGLTYEAVPEWKLGVESWGGFEVEHTDEFAASVGPAVSWAPASTLWIATTAGFGVTDYADDFSVRAIIGMDL
jgi:hypothetical protein